MPKYGMRASAPYSMHVAASSAPSPCGHAPMRVLIARVRRAIIVYCHFAEAPNLLQELFTWTGTGTLAPELWYPGEAPGTYFWIRTLLSSPDFALCGRSPGPTGRQ